MMMFFIIQITVADLDGEEWDSFINLIPYKMTEPPWNYNQTLLAGKSVSMHVESVHLDLSNGVMVVYLKSKLGFIS